MHSRYAARHVTRSAGVEQSALSISAGMHRVVTDDHQSCDWDLGLGCEGIMQESADFNMLNGGLVLEHTPAGTEYPNDSGFDSLESDKAVLMRTFREFEDFGAFTEFKLGTDLCDQSCRYRDMLQKTLERYATLQMEADIMRNLLDGKTKAAAVLKEKLEECVQKEEIEIINAESSLDILTREVGKLQFELEYKEHLLEETQVTWLQKYESTYKEYKILQQSLGDKEIELRKLLSKTDYLTRERDELLSCLDSKSKSKYQRTCSITSSDSYDEYTADDLGILGACDCRDKSHKPCKCAKAACARQKDLENMHSKMNRIEEKYAQSCKLVDVYRSAFEEQLYENRKLRHDLASKSIGKDDLKIPDLLKDGIVLGKVRGSQYDKSSTITSLIDVICDKTEVIKHHKVMCKVLAQRIEELNEQLKKHETEANN